MGPIMLSLFTSRRWSYRLIRIAVIATVAWWLVNSSGFVSAQLPSSLEWPHTDFDTAIVDMDEIMSGGPPKDGIPAIDNPKFVSQAEADDWLDDQEPVIVVSVGEQSRAYPIQILMFHEIVNDALNAKPLSITFCPLCNASIVFERNLDGTVLDFGTTGCLRKSDLVMYDRQTESWWQQFTGTGIIGHYAGVVLKRYPASIVAYREYKSAYPNGDVLSQDTGHRYPYGHNPYRGYDSIDDQPFLFRDPVDPRLPPMEYVLNISIGDTHRLYPFTGLESSPVINDEVNGEPVVVLSRDGTYSALDGDSIAGSRVMASATAFSRRIDDQVLNFLFVDGRIIDDETGSSWNLLGQATDGPFAGRSLNSTPSGVHFAFAWLAFNPNSEIYGQNQ